MRVRFRVTLKVPDKYFDKFDMIIEEKSEDTAIIEAMTRYYNLAENKMETSERNNITAIDLMLKFKITEI